MKRLKEWIGTLGNFWEMMSKDRVKRCNFNKYYKKFVTEIRLLQRVCQKKRQHSNRQEKTFWNLNKILKFNHRDRKLQTLRIIIQKNSSKNICMTKNNSWSKRNSKDFKERWRGSSMLAALKSTIFLELLLKEILNQLFLKILYLAQPWELSCIKLRMIQK